MEKRARKKRQYLKKKMAENFPNLMKDINIQEAQQAPDKMKKSETHTKTHCNQTSKKQREL